MLTTRQLHKKTVEAINREFRRSPKLKEMTMAKLEDEIYDALRSDDFCPTYRMACNVATALREAGLVTDHLPPLVAALVALTKENIPTDVQELLVYGNPDRGVNPGALGRALFAGFDAAWEIAKADRKHEDRSERAQPESAPEKEGE